MKKITDLAPIASAATPAKNDVINVGENITFGYLRLLMNVFCVNSIRHSNANPEITYVPGVQSFA